eukprot:334740_1
MASTTLKTLTNTFTLLIIINSIEHVSALTTLSFTANTTVPPNITCHDPTGCDIRCGSLSDPMEGIGCQNITINASLAGYLILQTPAAWAFRYSVIYCPQNAKCTIDTINYAALSKTEIYCGLNGTCAILHVHHKHYIASIFTLKSLRYAHNNR